MAILCKHVVILFEPVVRLAILLHYLSAADIEGSFPASVDTQDVIAIPPPDLDSDETEEVPGFAPWATFMSAMPRIPRPSRDGPSPWTRLQSCPMLAAALQLEPLSNVVSPAALPQLTELGLVVYCMAVTGAALVHECGVLEVPPEVVQVRDIAMAWAITSSSVAAAEQAGDLFRVPHCAIAVSDVWNTISQIGNPPTPVLHAFLKSLTMLKN